MAANICVYMTARTALHVTQAVITMKKYLLLYDLRKFMIKRGMRVYDSLFFTGPIVFFIIYLHTDSFIAAISILAFIWVLAIATYLSYRFQFGDVGGYIRDLKNVKQSLRNRFINTILAICILSVCYAGIFSGAFIGSKVFGNNGFVYLVFGFIGAILFLKLFYISILKRLENI